LIDHHVSGEIPWRSAALEQLQKPACRRHCHCYCHLHLEEEQELLLQRPQHVMTKHEGRAASIECSLDLFVYSAVLIAHAHVCGSLSLARAFGALEKRNDWRGQLPLAACVMPIPPWEGQEGPARASGSARVGEHRAFAQLDCATREERGCGDDYEYRCDVEPWINAMTFGSSNFLKWPHRL
jgi:hypothetical protein